MWFTRENRGACREYEAQLEDHLAAMRSGGPIPMDADLAIHLAACDGCRRGLAEAQEAGALLAGARQALPESMLDDPFFAGRVMARVRAYEAARMAGADFWPALETLSLRLSAAALSVALVLGAWAAWQNQGSHGPAPVDTARVRTVAGDARPAESRYLFPEMKRPPANAGEAMMVLASTENGRQR